MTTFMLVGGSEIDANTNFGQRLSKTVASFASQPKILDCQFAKPDLPTQKASYQGWLKFFDEYFPGSEVELARQESFYEQVAWADVVYLHGGSTKTILEALPDYQKVQQAFEGKIVIGSSAGANYVSNYCFSPNADRVIKSNSFLDISLIVHYSSTQIEDKVVDMAFWRSAVDRVRQASGKDEVLLLPEGEFVVIQK